MRTRNTVIGSEDRRRRWATWVHYAAAAWSLGYGMLGLYWASGGPGFPFGMTNDPGGNLSIFREAQADLGGPIIGVLGAVGAVVGWTMRAPRRGALHVFLVGFAWTAAGFLMLVVPDLRPLTMLGYSPLILFGAPFGWPPGVELADVFPWPVINQLICILGGVLWAGAGFAYRRRLLGSSTEGGDDARAWTAADAATRWGRWAVAVAVAVPLFYALTRFAWVLGIPLGITEEFLREGQATGLWWGGAALATLAVAGSILTLGLIRPWGEVFPAWFPLIGGRRVPPRLAIIPASVVSILVTSAGLTLVRLVILGSPTDDQSLGEGGGWLAIAPGLLWPVWGVALGAATLAYHLRRRVQSSESIRAPTD